MNDDWIYRWKDGSSEVSSEDMQRLWGRLLAGEVKSPGKYSLRCLDFIRNLSLDEAKLIEDVSRYNIGGLLAKDLVDKRVPYHKLLELEDLGILSGVMSGGLTNQMKPHDGGKGEVLLYAKDNCLRISGGNFPEAFAIKAYRVTPLGEQIMGLGRLEDDVSFIREFGRFFAVAGFDVYMNKYSGVEGGKYVMMLDDGSKILSD